MNKDPLISVIMTFYNARNTLDDAVKSILNQSFIYFEYVSAVIIKIFFA